MFALMTPAASAWAPSTAPVAQSAPPRAAVVRMQRDYNPDTFDPLKAGFGVQMETVEDGTKPDGAHGTGYRFMPLMSIEPGVAPMLLPIAGFHLGVTADQIVAPQSLPQAEPGRWIYHRLLGDALPTGFVTLQGSEQMIGLQNCVAVVCSSTSLGLELPDGNEHEVVAIIDRDDPAVADPLQFDPQSFYAFADAAGAVHIRWMDALPADWRVMGSLVYTQMPFVKKPGAGGGFAEFDDDFAF